MRWMEGRLRLFVWHVLVVVLLLTLFVLMVATTSPNEGANIGAGLVGLPLLVLGLPWTLPVLVNPYWFDHWSDAAHYALWFGPAFVNIAIHAALIAAARRRRDSR